MPELNSDSVQIKDRAEHKSGDQDALINKVAQEMAGGQKTLMTFDKAPENALTRYGLAALDGVANMPAGALKAVKHNIDHPVDALKSVGMGAGMAVVLKTVLPEGGPAGKIAAGAIGAYFTYQAVTPVIDGMKKAGVATTMKDLNAASVQIGDAGGAFLVDSALAVGGYKLGSRLIDPVLSSSYLKGFNEAKTSAYNAAGAKISDALGMTSGKTGLGNPFHPEGYGVIPPYLLQELAQRNPGNGDFLKTHSKTVDMQSTSAQARPRTEAGTGNAAREVYDAQGQETQPGKRARFEGEKPTGNVEVDNGYDYTGFVRDFYQKEFGRNGIDGKGMKFVSTVNYGQNYENAFWDGKQMTYGRPGADSPFRTFVILDVAGHEITHGITEMEAGTVYRGQSGALNEHYSDVFGVLIEQYSKGHTADKANWIVGENIWKPEIKGRGLRDMLNPGEAYNDPAVGKDPQPAHMKDYYKTWGDNGGVHYNSGIPNKAFATFARAVGGNAWDGPGHIWFEARKAAGSNPSFGQFAYHTIEAAKKLGKLDEVPKLEKAWETVGVKPDINAKDTTTPGGGGGDDAKVSLLGRLFGRKAS
ncbi:MAG: M4 family metallopeptidase [Candidatus Obscuribacterales bacterium]|nr:M4 family metallopeptidase [Candidatus Obscuribacterales bacterium]